MTKPDLSNYNDFGRWIYQEKRGLSIAQVARRGGIDQTKLGRIMRKKPFRSPDLESIEAIARGLGRSVGSVQAAVMRAVGGVPAGEMTGAQRTIVDVTAGFDEDWQQVIADIVLRLSEELARRDRFAP